MSFRNWWADFSDDILGADLGPGVYDEDAGDGDRSLYLAHPHRRPLAVSWTRRDGTVAPAAAHCVSPVSRVRSATDERLQKA